MMSSHVSHGEFIPGAGTSLTTYNVLERRGRIRWMVRAKPRNEADNGWRVFSHIDTSEYLADQANWAVVDFNTLCALEPALIGIWNLPVGSDLQIVDDGQRIRVVDTPTGREIPLEEQFDPTAPPPPEGWPQYRGYTDPADDFLESCKTIFSGAVTELTVPWQELVVAFFIASPAECKIRALADGGKITGWPAGRYAEELAAAAGTWHARAYRDGRPGALFGAVKMTRQPPEMRFVSYHDAPPNYLASDWEDDMYSGDEEILRTRLARHFTD